MKVEFLVASNFRPVEGYIDLRNVRSKVLSHEKTKKTEKCETKI